MLLRIDLHDLFVNRTNSHFVNYIILSDVTQIYKPNISNHNLSELHYVQSGTGYLQVENEVFKLSKNDFFIINPNVMHGEFVEKTESFRYFIIGINNAFFSSETNINIAKPIKIDSSADIIRTIERLYNEAKEDFLNREKAIIHLCDLLLIDAQRIYNVKIASIKYKSPNALINHVQEYLDENYKEVLTVNSIAEHFFCNPSTLSQNFKKYVGVSIIHFILIKRIEDAKMLLSISDMPICQISSTLNFCNPVYFSFYFKKIVDVSPTDYRKNLKKEPINELSENQWLFQFLFLI